MTPPIFPLVAASLDVQAIFGSTPVRFYSFGRVPENTPYPYAVWQLSTGAPENYLGQRPDVDSLSVQVDVYAQAPGDARSGGEALRDAIEGAAHITLFRGEERDPSTNAFRVGFNCDFWVPRAP